MGIEKIIKRMNPKRKQLYERLISLGVVAMILYITYVIIVDLRLDILQFFSHPAFYESIIVFILLGIFWSVLHGEKIRHPEDLLMKPIQKK
jgi:hypothetical protein